MASRAQTHNSSCSNISKYVIIHINVCIVLSMRHLQPSWWHKPIDHAKNVPQHCGQLFFCWIWMSKSENRIVCEIYYFTSQCSVARTFGTQWQHNRGTATLDLAMTAWRTRSYLIFRHTGINFASGYNVWCDSLWIVKISVSSICPPHSSMPMIKYGVCYGSERHGVTNHWKLDCLCSSFCVSTGDQCSHSQR